MIYKQMWSNRVAPESSLPCYCWPHAKGIGENYVIQ